MNQLRLQIFDRIHYYNMYKFLCRFRNDNTIKQLPGMEIGITCMIPASQMKIKGEQKQN